MRAPAHHNGSPVQIGGAPVDVALAGDTAWVADAAGGRIVAVDSPPGAIGRTIDVGRRPVAIAAAGEDVYVVTAGESGAGPRRSGPIAPLGRRRAGRARRRRRARVGRLAQLRRSAAVRALMRRFVLAAAFCLVLGRPLRAARGRRGAVSGAGALPVRAATRGRRSTSSCSTRRKRSARSRPRAGTWLAITFLFSTCHDLCPAEASLIGSALERVGDGVLAYARQR